MKFKFFVVTLSLLFILKTNSSIAQSNHPGFFLDSWLPKTIAISAYDTIPQSGKADDVMVTVNADSIISKVSKYVYGHNAAGWGGKLEQSALLVNGVKALSPNVIRWPGGSLSDNYFWKASSEATCPDDLPPGYEFSDLMYGLNNKGWTMSTDSYYALLKKTNSEGMITVNYGYARLGTSEDPVMTAAKYAADWVRYDNGRTRYWEIGNEDFGSWENGYKINTEYNKDGQPEINSGTLYGKHCRVFIEEMRKAAREIGSDIKIGVVAMDSHVTWDDVQQKWNQGMMAEVADLADFIIVHSYYTPYQENSTVATILNSPDKTVKMNQYINNGLKTYASHDPLPIALTEYNIFAEGSAQQVSYIDGMHGALVLGELIKNKYGQGSRWDFMNGWSDGDSHGLFADGEPGIPKYTPRAPFFYMYYFQKFFGDRMIYSSVSGSANIKCYASRFSSGQTGMVVVNKGTTEKVIKLAMENFSLGSHYFYYLLTGGTDNGNFSRKVYVNGKTTNYDGGGPDNYTSILPYGTDIDGDIKIDLPPLSVAYVVVESKANLEEQTIHFEAIPSKIVGDEDFELSASSTSGLPVQFASKTPEVALVKDHMVHIIGAGTCELVAFQEGSAEYLPADQVVQSFDVGKGDQTITFPELETKTYGDEPFMPGATASSGLACSYTSSNYGIVSIVDDVITVSGEGTVTITAKQEGNVDYNPAEPVSQVLVINPKTGIGDLNAKATVEVYPNPTSERVTIKSNLPDSKLTIYNSMGVPVFTHSINGELIIPKYKIGSKGVYFVHVNNLVKKLVIL